MGTIVGISSTCKVNKYVLFSKLVFDGMRKYLFKKQFQEYTIGWQEPIAPILIKQEFGQTYRTKDMEKYTPTVSSKKQISSKEVPPEDIYPLY